MRGPAQPAAPACGRAAAAATPAAGLAGASGGTLPVAYADGRPARAWCRGRPARARRRGWRAAGARGRRGGCGASTGAPGGGHAARFPRRELPAAARLRRRCRFERRARRGRRLPARPPEPRESLAIGVRGHVAGRRRGRPAARLIDDGPGLGHRRVRRWIAGGQGRVTRFGLAAPGAVTLAVHAQPGGADGRTVPHGERAGWVDRARLARHGRITPDRAPPPR